MTLRAPRPLILALVVATGCAPAAPTCDEPADLGIAGGDLLIPDADDAPAFPSFALGVEYLQVGLAQPYADAGAAWGKTRLEAFSWDATEPAAPRGGEHTYDWRCTDGQVGSWQQAGVERLQSYLQPESRWGSRGPNTDLRPKASREDDYQAWVGALVERYDGDGVDDMPGLVRPVRHWVVGGEWTGFWPQDDADSYLHVLDLTREAALAADPTAQLGTIPLMMIDVFDGNEPPDEEIDLRLQDPPPNFRNSSEGALAILDRTDLYDYVCVHSLGDYTELAPMARWLRRELDARDADKPLWIDDAFATSFLANGGYWPAFHPVTDATYEGAYAALLAVAAGDDPDATAWIEAEVAKGVVHKAVTALAEGYVGLNLGNTEDWMPAQGTTVRQGSVQFIGAAAAMGWVDVAEGQGQQYSVPRTPGEARPALAAFELVAGLLGDGDFDTIERLGGPTGVRGYRLERAGTPLWVLWAEDDVLQLPDEDEEATELALTLPDGVESVRVTVTPTTRGADLHVDEVTPPDGVLRRDLTSVPIFVEPL